MKNNNLVEAITDGRLLIIRRSMLAPFTSPSTWRVDPEMRRALARLAGVIPVVVMTSGTVAEARDALDLDEVHLVGLSGGEFWRAHDVLPETDARVVGSVSAIRALIAEHRPALEEAGGVVEPHGVLHFGDTKGREDPRAREAVERVIEEAQRRGMFVCRDLTSYKVRPAETEHAAREVLEKLRPDRVTILGFDEEDVAIFGVLQSEYEDRRLRALCTIGALYDGHSQPVVNHAHTYVTGFEGVRDLIAGLATALTPRQHGIA